MSLSATNGALPGAPTLMEVDQYLLGPVKILMLLVHLEKKILHLLQMPAFKELWYLQWPHLFKKSSHSLSLGASVGSHLTHTRVIANQ